MVMHRRKHHSPLARRSTGFSALELVYVLVIAAGVTGIVLNQIGSTTRNSLVKKAQLDVQAIKVAIQRVKQSKVRAKATNANLNILTQFKYLPKHLQIGVADAEKMEDVNPWGHDYYLDWHPTESTTYIIGIEFPRDEDADFILGIKKDLDSFFIDDKNVNRRCFTLYTATPVCGQPTDTWADSRADDYIWAMTFK